MCMQWAIILSLFLSLSLSLPPPLLPIYVLHLFINILVQFEPVVEMSTGSIRCDACELVVKEVEKMVETNKTKVR